MRPLSIHQRFFRPSPGSGKDISDFPMRVQYREKRFPSLPQAPKRTYEELFSGGCLKLIDRRIRPLHSDPSGVPASTQY